MVIVSCVLFDLDKVCQKIYDFVMEVVKCSGYIFNSMV